MAADDSLEEWKEARSIMARFDEDQHDLRKYGFSFITALLTADAILPNALTTGSSAVPGYTKLAILLVTLGLFIALRLLDQHYRLFIEAAAQRAMILERRLNVDLTNNISLFYSWGGWWRDVQAFYLGFLILTVSLGLAILYPGLIEMGVLIIGASVAGLELTWINQRTLTDAQDWSLDKKSIPHGDTLRIMWTSLEVTAKKDPSDWELEWKLVSQTGEEIDGNSTKLQAQYLDSFDWLSKKIEAPQGLYQFKVRSTRNGRVKDWETYHRVQVVETRIEREPKQEKPKAGT